MPRAYDAQAGRRAVFDALIDARNRHGGGRPILEDQERHPLTYTALIRAAFGLGRRLAGFTARGEHVGVLLPSSAGGVVTFFALHAIGRVPTMLNFTAGLRNLKAACASARVKTILTSRRFISQGKLDDLLDALKA
ncbi:MAG: AMP-binding protein, partial [Caulobacteraceae bacterium]|nr:AMP-binding protein [Caulobacteraceae bacterium]